MKNRKGLNPFLAMIIYMLLSIGLALIFSHFKILGYG